MQNISASPGDTFGSKSSARSTTASSLSESVAGPPSQTFNSCSLTLTGPFNAYSHTISLPHLQISLPLEKKACQVGGNIRVLFIWMPRIALLQQTVRTKHKYFTVLCSRSFFSKTSCCTHLTIMVDQNLIRSKLLPPLHNILGISV